MAEIKKKRITMQEATKRSANLPARLRKQEMRKAVRGPAKEATRKNVARYIDVTETYRRGKK